MIVSYLKMPNGATLTIYTIYSKTKTLKNWTWNTALKNYNF